MCGRRRSNEQPHPNHHRRPGEGRGWAFLVQPSVEAQRRERQPSPGSSPGRRSCMGGGRMKVRFEQVRLIQNFSRTEDLARAADEIILAHRLKRVANTVGARESLAEKEDYDSERIVAKFGQIGFLGFIRHAELWDAAVLPYEKMVIRKALINCGLQDWLTDEEVEALGELHYMLSYFIIGLEYIEEGQEELLLAQQHAERVTLRTEWQETVINRRKSWISRALSSWLVQ